MNKELRENQAKQFTQALREELEEAGDDSHPFLYAEEGPNRFQTFTLFFPEDDGVRVTLDIDLDITTVHYFTDSGEEELTSGALYEWAMKNYLED